MKKLLKLFVVLFIVFFSIGCSDSKPDKLIVDYTNDLDENDSILIINGYKEINVFAKYDDDTNRTITDTLKWSSSDMSIADVPNNDGIVYAKSLLGSVDIRYETKEKSSDGLPIHSNSITLNVLDLILQGIKLSESTLDISIGASKSIEVTGIYEYSFETEITKNCDWNSSNPDIAKVDENGSITGISEGNVTITTSCKDESLDLNVSIVKVKYSSLSIQAPTTEFNVEQTIQLELRATNDRNETVVLESANVTWDSNATDIAEIDKISLVVTALAKGKVKLTGTIVDTEIESSITLSVIKDKYLRIYKDGEEVEFSYTNTNEYETLPDNFSEFKIISVGQEFTISDLNVTDLNGTVSVSGEFQGLENGDVIYEDDNTTFVLIHDGSEEELRYIFKINDTAGSTFDAKYYETLN